MIRLYLKVERFEVANCDLKARVFKNIFRYLSKNEVMVPCVGIYDAYLLWLN
jgi:hypothetical protein